MKIWDFDQCSQNSKNGAFKTLFWRCPIIVVYSVQRIGLGLLELGLGLIRLRVRVEG